MALSKIYSSTETIAKRINLMTPLLLLLIALYCANTPINLLSADPVRAAEVQAFQDYLAGIDSPAANAIREDFKKQVESGLRYQEEYSKEIIYHSCIREFKNITSPTLSIREDLNDGNVSRTKQQAEMFPKTQGSYGVYRNAEKYTTSTSSETIACSIYKGQLAFLGTVARPTQIANKDTMSHFAHYYINKRIELIIEPIKTTDDATRFVDTIRHIKTRNFYEKKGLCTAAAFLLWGPIIAAAIKPWSTNGMKLCMVLGIIGGAFGLGIYLYHRYLGHCETKVFHDQQTVADTFAVNSGDTKDKKIALAKAGIELLSDQNYSNCYDWKHEASPSIWFTHPFRSKKARIKHLEKMIKDLEAQK